MIWFVWIDTVAIISDTIITCAFWMIQTKQFIRKRRLPPVHISQISVFMVTTLFKEIHDEFLETFSIFGCWCIQKVLWRMWNCRSMRFKFQLIGFCMNIVRLPHSNSDFQFMRERGAFNFRWNSISGWFCLRTFRKLRTWETLSNERWQVNCTNWNAIWRSAFCAFRSGEYNINKYRLCSHPFSSIQLTAYTHT